MSFIFNYPFERTVTLAVNYRYFLNNKDHYIATLTSLLDALDTHPALTALERPSLQISHWSGIPNIPDTSDTVSNLIFTLAGDSNPHPSDTPKILQKIMLEAVIETQYGSDLYNSLESNIKQLDRKEYHPDRLPMQVTSIKHYSFNSEDRVLVPGTTDKRAYPYPVLRGIAKLAYEAVRLHFDKW